MKKEANLQRAAFQWLQLHRIFAWRMPVGPVIHRRKSKSGFINEHWKKSPLKGFPDIAGVLRKKHPGVLFVWELKSDTGELSPEQVQWLTDLQAAGVKCAVIRSVDDMIAAMVRWGEIQPPQGLLPVGENLK